MKVFNPPSYRVFGVMWPSESIDLRLSCLLFRRAPIYSHRDKIDVVPNCSSINFLRGVSCRRCQQRDKWDRSFTQKTEQNMVIYEIFPIIPLVPIFFLCSHDIYIIRMVKFHIWTPLTGAERTQHEGHSRSLIAARCLRSNVWMRLPEAVPYLYSAHL